MRKIVHDLSFGLARNNRLAFSSQGEGADFLKMVESYFDKASRFTNIRADKLNFYKRPENVVKCSITLVRGYSIVIQMMGSFKLSLLSDASIKPINYRQKVELDMLKMSIFKRLKL